MLKRSKKDIAQTAWLNRLKINQVHKAVVKLNEWLTFDQIFEADSFVNADGQLVYNGQRYKVVAEDLDNERYQVRRLGLDEQGE
jgi:hypothetical protein